LETEREPVQDVPAVYFVMPTDENIRRICKVTKILSARWYASAVQVLAVVLCLSVYLFVTWQYCIETAAHIKLIFDVQAYPNLSYAVF